MFGYCALLYPAINANVRIQILIRNQNTVWEFIVSLLQTRMRVSGFITLFILKTFISIVTLNYLAIEETDHGIQIKFLSCTSVIKVCH